MRERFGVGQEVHVSILGTTIYMNYFNTLMATMGGFEVPRHTRTKEHPMRNFYQCADGRWLMMTLTPTERHWGPLCLALDSPELENDARFQTEENRQAHAEELVAIFDGIFSGRPLEEWLRVFAENDLFGCAVNSVMDLMNDPQAIENDYLMDFDHPALGKVKMPGYPGYFSESRAGIRSAAPELGEHTEDVLSGIAEYSPEEIAAFKEEGII